MYVYKLRGTTQWALSGLILEGCRRESTKRLYIRIAGGKEIDRRRGNFSCLPFLLQTSNAMKHPTSAPTTASRPTKRARIDSETKHTEKKKSKEPVSILKQKQKSTKSTSPTKSSNTHPAPSPSRKEKKKKEKSTPLPSQASLYAEGAQKKPNGTKTSPESKQLPSSFTLIAGSYEKLLYGIQCTISTTATTTTSDGQAPTLPSASSGIEFRLEPLFIFPAHVSCIKAVSASPNGGKWLATGSTDEIVKVWDLRRRKEIGGLMHHEGKHRDPTSSSRVRYSPRILLTYYPLTGSITYLNFPSRSHLLSASEDGTLCLFRCRDWAVLRALRGHKGRVNCVAIHPSGKLALSVGKDRTLRMWDLMRGKGSASTKLGKGMHFATPFHIVQAFILFSAQRQRQYIGQQTVRYSLSNANRV